MSGPKLIEFPDRNVQNLPETLRSLADNIEKGTYGDAHNLAWVIDCGDGKIEAGLIGSAPEPATTAYFLLGLGKRLLESSAGN